MGLSLSRLSAVVLFGGAAFARSCTHSGVTNRFHSRRDAVRREAQDDFDGDVKAVLQIAVSPLAVETSDDIAGRAAPR